MLMHTVIFDNHDIASLPVDMPSVVDIVFAPLKRIEHSAVEMLMLLAGVFCPRPDLHKATEESF
jgi:hypothetical protein